MNDRTTTVTIGFDGDAGTIDAVLSAIKGKFRSAVAEIEATTKNLQLFGDLETRTQAAAAALGLAKTKVVEFTAALEAARAAGAGSTTELEKSLRSATAQLKAAEVEYNRSVDALTKLENSLSRAGVETSNLARAQLKLAESSKVATAAAAEQAAKQALGVKTLADIQPQLAKLQAAYVTLRESGTLSSKELANAQALLQQKIKETQATVTTSANSFKLTGAQLSGAFTTAAAGALGFVAIVGSVVESLHEAVLAAQEFENGLAKIGSVTALSKEQLATLGDGARALSTELGIALPEAMQALFAIVRSGVPADNALEVLRASAEASKAAVTTLGAGVKAGTELIDAFGLEVNQLPAAFDAIVKGAHLGGVTLDEFSQNAGGLLNVARSLGVGFTDLIAILAVMTDASNDAQGSITALQKILVKLGEAGVREKLRDLGIETTNVVEIFTQLAQKRVTVNTIIDLGIASERSAVGVAALTNNLDKLPDTAKKVADSLGEVKRSAEATFDTPAERAKRFNAALEESKVILGETVGASSALASAGAKLLNTLNALTLTIHSGFNPEVQRATISGTLLDNALSRWVSGLLGVQLPAKEAAAAVKLTGDQAAAASAALKAATGDLGLFADKLAASVKAIQASGAGTVAEINANVDRQIAALDRGVNAQAATSKASIEIQRAAAAERLAVIADTEAKVTAATEKAAAARSALLADKLRGDVNAEAKIAAEIAKLRLDSLAPVLAQYQDHYNKLVALAQQHKARIDSIEQQRIDFNRGVAQTLLDLQNQSSLSALSALDLYAQKVRQIDQLIADARAAGIAGNIEKAKQYTDQAIALSSTLKEVVNKDGITIISAFEAQTTAIRKIKAAQDGYNESLDEGTKGAEDGLKATREGIDAVVPKLEVLQARFDALKAAADKGIDLAVTLDEASVDKAFATLDKLAAPRTTTITVNTVQGEGGTAAPAPAPAPGFAAGGAVLRRGPPLYLAAARHFAGGGFALPAWRKVPGAGSGDTVPAALPLGAFVLSRAASRFYGDGRLSRLARGFAAGGAVAPLRLARGGDIAPQLNAFSAQVMQGGETNIPLLVHNLKVVAEQEFTKILERATGLPHATWGQDVRDYVGRVLELVRRSDNPDEIKTYLARVLDYYQSFYPAIENARQFNVPLVMGFYSAATPPEGNAKAAQKLVLLEGFTPSSQNAPSTGRIGAPGQTGGIIHFERGGPAPDTVPAWLTPGEWIISPQAVRRYGGRALHAINQMRVPRGVLDLALAAPSPQRFYAGGPVGAVAASSGPVNGSGASGGSRAVTINIYAQRVDEAEVRRSIIPVLDKISRSSR